MNDHREIVFAKSFGGGESLQQHTEKLLDAYESLKKRGVLKQEFLQRYDAVIKRMLELHDAGKLNYRFQNRIRKNLNLPLLKNDMLDTLPEIPHEWLSLAFLSKEERKELRKNFPDPAIVMPYLLFYSIAYHHTRKGKEYCIETIQKYIEYDLKKRKALLWFNPAFNISPPQLEQVQEAIHEKFKEYLPLLVFFKGILHRCDYAASAGIEPELPPVADYSKRFQEALDAKGIVLRNYQEDAKKFAKKNVIFVGSTGAGKTEYSMNWIDGDKAFYLLGLRTAVNEMYKRFASIFGEEHTVLLHGESFYDMYQESEGMKKEEYEENYSRVRQFSYPLTVATADQLITSVFKYNGFEMPYLVASYSKIVIDEVQSFSPESIGSIVVFLQEISRLGGKFLLMTATLPPFLKEELKELAVFPPSYLSPIKRHRLSIVEAGIEEDESFREIRQAFNENKKVLVICNTVNKAIEMAEKLSECKPQLLHARFIVKDRREKEEAVMQATKPSNRNGCLWITTQIVEASLDIDFDILFTECSTIDSLLQRLGRCYRKRAYSEEVPNVMIFKSGKNDSFIYDTVLLKRTWEAVKKKNRLLLSEEEKQDLIEEVYCDIEDTKYFRAYCEYKDLLQLGFKCKGKTEAQKLFRNVTDSHTIIPEPVYQENKPIIEQLMKTISDKNISFTEKMQAKKELKDFTLSLQPLPRMNKYLSELQQKKIRLLKNVEYNDRVGMTYNKEPKENDDNFI